MNKNELKRRKKIACTISIKRDFKYDIETIFEVSSRTTSKILKRMWELNLISCSNCGWNKCVCNIHHINGKKIKNADKHENLCYLCPNCHRMVHNGLISNDQLISLDKFIGDEWKKYFYGYRTKKTEEQIILEENERKKIIEEKLNKIEKRKLLVLKSNIDFSKFGWGIKLSEKFNISPQKTKKWVQKYMPEFYEKNCYKKNNY